MPRAPQHLAAAGEQAAQGAGDRGEDSVIDGSTVPVRERRHVAEAGRDHADPPMRARRPRRAA
jgi:hypothetical protein